MPLYRISLARSFMITVRSANPTLAQRIAELYLGYNDDSTPADRERFNFSITDIEMTLNEAVEVVEALNK